MRDEGQQTTSTREGCVSDRNISPNDVIMAVLFFTEILGSGNLKSGRFRISRKILLGGYRLDFQNLDYRSRARATDSGKWAPNFQRDRAPLKSVFVLHGEDFPVGYLL